MRLLLDIFTTIYFEGASVSPLMQVSKWGNSLAVRLPKQLVDELGLKAGEELAVVDASKSRLAVEKADRRKRAIANIRARAWTLPADYTFDRDEANER